MSTTRDPKTFCLRVLFFSEVQVSMKQPRNIPNNKFKLLEGLTGIEFIQSDLVHPFDSPSIFSPECLQGKALMHSIRAFFMAKRVLAQCLGLKTAKNASRSGFLCLVKPPPTGPPILA